MIDGSLATDIGLSTIQTSRLISESNSPLESDALVGEVLKIISSDDPIDAGRIQVRLLSKKSSDNGKLQTATPLNSNIRIYPFLHETVPIFIIDGNYYWSSPLNYYNLAHNNAVNKISYLEPSTANKLNTAFFSPRKKRNDNTYVLFDDTVKDLKTSIPILKNGPGDMVFQGRFSNTIRFGGGKDNKTGCLKLNLSTENGGYNTYHEDIDKDNSIWITSDEDIKFKKIGPSISNYNNPPSVFDKNQIFIMSDRIVFGSRKFEILGFSNKSISFTCNKNFSADSDSSIKFTGKNDVSLISKKIRLGSNDSSHPIILGDKLIDVLRTLLRSIMSMTMPVGTAPTTGIPLNIADFQSILAKLDSIKSNTTFTD